MKLQLPHPEYHSDSGFNLRHTAQLWASLDFQVQFYVPFSSLLAHTAHTRPACLSRWPFNKRVGSTRSVAGTRGHAGNTTPRKAASAPLPRAALACGGRKSSRLALWNKVTEIQTSRVLAKVGGELVNGWEVQGREPSRN